MQCTGYGEKMRKTKLNLITVEEFHRVSSLSYSATFRCKVLKNNLNFGMRVRTGSGFSMCAFGQEAVLVCAFGQEAVLVCAFGQEAVLVCAFGQEAVLVCAFGQEAVLVCAFGQEAVLVCAFGQEAVLVCCVRTGSGFASRKNQMYYMHT